MNRTHGTSIPAPLTASFRKHRVNWHEAVACAIEIELRDYADFLQFLSEYNLGRNSYRIDLLVIKKVSEQVISKNIARIFKTYNLFEYKGLHSSITIGAYYKTIGYAGFLIDQLNNTKSGRYSSLHVSISFLTFHYPRKLIKHLTEELHLAVEKFSEGIYYINIEIFNIQIIVTKQLPPDENLYLRCLTNDLQDPALINRLADDYARHQGQDTYIKYLNQITTANNNTKGESAMICEGLLNLFGTSSAEIIANAKKESEAQIHELSETNEQLSKTNTQLFKTNSQLSSRIDYLQELLRQNNISFE